MIAVVGDKDIAFRVQSERSWEVELSGCRRATIAAESGGAAARNGREGSIGTYFADSVVCDVDHQQIACSVYDDPPCPWT